MLTFIYYHGRYLIPIIYSVHRMKTGTAGGLGGRLRGDEVARCRMADRDGPQTGPAQWAF